MFLWGFFLKYLFVFVFSSLVCAILFYFILFYFILLFICKTFVGIGGGSLGAGLF